MSLQYSVLGTDAYVAYMNFNQSNIGFKKSILECTKIILLKASDPLSVQHTQTELEFGIINCGMRSTVYFEALIVLVLCSFTIRIEELNFSWEFFMEKTEHYFRRW